VIRTAWAQPAQRLRPRRAGEGERVLVLGVVRDHAPVGGDDSAERRENSGGQLTPVGERRVREAAEGGPFSRAMLGDEFAHLVDGPDAVDVTLALRRPPREKAMAAEDQSGGAGMIRDGLF